MRLTGIPILALVAGVLAGCQPGGAHQPPTVRFGEEACASCRMIIGDDHFAAAMVTPAGDALKFDDIGCLIEHESERIRPDVVYWVRDVEGRGWLDARAATFVHSPGVSSPMGFGLAAHPAGRASADPKGRTLRLEELPGFLADRSREADSEPPAGPKAETSTAANAL